MRVTIDEKGGLILPKEIIDRMGLQPGDELEIEELNDRIRLTKSTLSPGNKQQTPEQPDQLHR
jgi:AbrB family looped-hinge helix DNA binding protein